MGIWDDTSPNATLLRKRASQAWANNQAFLALPTPITLAQAQQQLFALTREMNGLLRLMFNQTDDISDS